jgi:hypothetical protein
MTFRKDTSAKTVPEFIPFPGLMPLACWIFTFSVLLEIFSSRCLYADGSYNFIEDLKTGQFTGFVGVRCFADDLFQFPLIVAIKLGVTNLHLLRLAFGVGCFLPWPLALSLCRWLSPENFWIAALACAAGYLNTAFMAVGEHIVAHAFFWPALFAILFSRPLTPLAAIVLLGSATILVHSYESLLFLGPCLAMLSLKRICNEETKDWRRLILLAATGLFLAAAAVAFFSVTNPDIPMQLWSFKDSMKHQVFLPAWTVVWSGVWLLLMAAVWASPPVCRFVMQRTGLVILTCVILLWGAWPLLMPDRLHPYNQHSARFLDLLVPLLLLPVSLIAALRPAWIASRRSLLVGLTAAFLIAQSLWQISATWQWQRYVGTLKGILSSRTGPVWPLDTPLRDNPALIQFDWNWANPCLGIAINSDGKINSIFLPELPPICIPFDPFVPGDLPKLERYGVDYSGYISALADFKKKIGEENSTRDPKNPPPFGAGIK